MQIPDIEALVLGGGGVAGIAWMTGLAAGFADEGLDLRRAGRIIGTSAGSTLAAQLGSDATIEELFQRHADPSRQSVEIAPSIERLKDLMGAFQQLADARDPVERGRRAGAMALACETADPAQRRAVIASRLPSHAWPKRRLSITAIDCASGALEVFEAGSGVELVDAVAASCAVPMIWPAVAIAGRGYIDGGLRSPDNADLAAGASSVLILSPIGLRPQGGLGSALAGEVALLEAGGAKVCVVEPDAQSRSSMGFNVLDPSVREPAARAGREQGRREAARILNELA
jgi:NTE family protein